MPTRGRILVCGLAAAGAALAVYYFRKKLRAERRRALAAELRRSNIPFSEVYKDQATRERCVQPARSLSLTDFELKKTVGTGSFARVRLATLDKKPVALKISKKHEVVRKRQVSHAFEELKVLQKVVHPFLATLLATFQTETRLYLVMEYLPGGELYTHLRREGRFTAHASRFYAAELASALAYMHARHILCREVKPENFVLDADGHVVLVDFGFTKLLDGPDGKAWTLCGTPEYLAPEIIKANGHGMCCDWWAFAILVYEMLHGHPPFYAEDPMAIYQKILLDECDISEQRCDADVTDLLQRLLVKDAAARLGHAGAADVLVHAWFAQIDWAAVVRRGLAPPFVPTLSGPCDTGQFETYPESVEPAAELPQTDPQDPELFQAWGVN